MKKFETLGRSLSKGEQKKIVGGLGCSQEGDVCGTFSGVTYVCCSNEGTCTNEKCVKTPPANP